MLNKQNMNPWIQHVKAFYAKNKGKMSYAQALKAAKATYKKGGSQKATTEKKKLRENDVVEKKPRRSFNCESSCD